MPFRLPTRLTLEPGSFTRLAEVLAEVLRLREGAVDRADETAPLVGSTVLLVYDPGLEATSWPDRAHSLLEAGGARITTWNRISPNPRAEEVEDLARQARDEGVTALVGVGGGSTLDAAKAAAMFAVNPHPEGIGAYEGRNRYARRPLPFVAVPTTCGTGSEVTWVSVISALDGDARSELPTGTPTGARRKISVKGDTMFPDAALVDAELLRTLPPPLVASTGMDALTHAVEAYVGRAANPISDPLAEAAARLLFRYLPRACADIDADHEAREAVMRASTLAGIAFGNADVGGVHCLSETIGGGWDIPHGLANAILLGPVMRSHLDAATERLARLDEAVRVGGAATVKAGATALLDRIDALTAEVGIPPFSSLGIPESAYPRIADGAVGNNSNGSNPRTMGSAEYLEILRAL